jgi:hypothetical protein
MKTTITRESICCLCSYPNPRNLTAVHAAGGVLYYCTGHARALGLLDGQSLWVYEDKPIGHLTISSSWVIRLSSLDA